MKTASASLGALGFLGRTIVIGKGRSDTVASAPSGLITVSPITSPLGDIGGRHVTLPPGLQGAPVLLKTIGQYGLRSHRKQLTPSVELPCPGAFMALWIAELGREREGH